MKRIVEISDEQLAAVKYAVDIQDYEGGVGVDLYHSIVNSASLQTELEEIASKLVKIANEIPITKYGIKIALDMLNDYLKETNNE